MDALKNTRHSLGPTTLDNSEHPAGRGTGFWSIQLDVARVLGFEVSGITTEKKVSRITTEKKNRVSRVTTETNRVSRITTEKKGAPESPLKTK